MSDDTLSMLADSAADFAKLDARRIRALRDTPEGFDRQVWRQMAELGWFSILIPEAQAGLGLNLAAATAVATRLGYAAYPEPFAASAVMAPWCLSRARSESCASEALSSVASGECVAALAWQNERGQLEVTQPTVSATLDGGNVHLSGSSRFIMPASADAFIVAADSAGGLMLVWVPRETAGLSIATEKRADGIASARLQLSGVRPPLANILSDRDAAGLLQSTVDAGLLAVSAELVGLMDRALEMTLEYLRTRKQFGKAIGSFQALQHRAVDIWIQRQLARAVLQASVAVFDSSASSPAARSAAAASAKARASQAALLMANQSIQLHGAIGFTDEYDLGLYVNRALSLCAWMGNAAEQRRRWGALTASTASSNR